MPLPVPVRCNEANAEGVVEPVGVPTSLWSRERLGDGPVPSPLLWASRPLRGWLQELVPATWSRTPTRGLRCPGPGIQSGGYPTSSAPAPTSVSAPQTEEQ